MTIKEEFYIQQHGKSFVLYQGLLAEAHERGLQSIETEILQCDTDENGEPTYAIVKARVTMESGQTYADIGDATRRNVGKSIAPHLIRMASTRAKARALRDSVNIGVTALEELEESDNYPEPVSGPKINDTQLETLGDMIDESGADVQKLCKFFGVQHLADLPASKMGTAMNMLRAKVKNADAHA